MLKRLLLIVVLPLLLLLAQQQLLAHEISHLTTHSQQQDKQQAPHQHFCAQCAHAADFSSGLAVHGWQIAITKPSSIQQPTAVFACCATLNQYVSARAPPTVL